MRGVEKVTMTSPRFEYQTSQDTQLYRQMIHGEDRVRKEFMERAPELMALCKAGRPHTGGVEASLVSVEVPSWSSLHHPSPTSLKQPPATPYPSAGAQQTLQLFSKKMKRQELLGNSGDPTSDASNALPPITRMYRQKHLIDDVNESTDAPLKPNEVAYPTDLYQTSRRYRIPCAQQAQNAATSSGGCLGPVALGGCSCCGCSCHRKGATDAATSCSGSGSVTGAGSSVSKILRHGIIPAPPQQPQQPQVVTQSTKAPSSIFSRGSSSLRGRQAAATSCAVAGAVGSSTGSSTLRTPASQSVSVGARTTSTQREKLRCVSERLSRLEAQVEASLAEDVDVTHTLKELKGIVLGMTQQSPGQSGGV